MKHFLTRIATVSSLLTSLIAGVHAEILPSSVRLQVYGTHQANDIIYHYKLINNSDESIQHFVLGSTFDSKLGYEIPQLKRLPTGWDYGRESETGTAIILSPTSTGQPPYWTSHVFGQEEISYYYLEWETAPDGQAYAIPPGQSLAGFSVTVPLIDNELTPHRYSATGPDDRYLRGSFKVSYWDTSKNDLKIVWGPFEIADTTAPTLSVTLSPDTLHQNGKHVPISATIMVKDDYDPQPDIKLLSITANEPTDKDDIKAKLFTDDRHFLLKADHDGKSHAGRIYTVTYVASDGSGNRTIVSSTVTVPHDNRAHEDRHDEKDKLDKDDHKRNR